MENLPQEKLDQINEVLNGLDPFDDNVWTTQGDPRMEVIQAKLGDETITRKHLKQANALFSREFLLKNQVKEANTPKPPAQENTEPAVEEQPLVISGHTTVPELLEIMKGASLSQVRDLVASLQSRKENIDSQKRELDVKLHLTASCLKVALQVQGDLTPTETFSQGVRSVLNQRTADKQLEEQKRQEAMQILGIKSQDGKQVLTALAGKPSAIKPKRNAVTNPLIQPPK